MQEEWLTTPEKWALSSPPPAPLVSGATVNLNPALLFGTFGRY